MNVCNRPSEPHSPPVRPRRVVEVGTHAPKGRKAVRRWWLVFGLAALTMLALPLYLGLAGGERIAGGRMVRRAARPGRRFTLAAAIFCAVVIRRGSDPFPWYGGDDGPTRRAVHRAVRTGRAMREALGKLDGKLS